MDKLIVEMTTPKLVNCINRNSLVAMLIIEMATFYTGNVVVDKTTTN